MLVIVQMPCELDEQDAGVCAMHLCRPGSEMQGEFLMRRSKTQVAVAYMGSPIGWVATHRWTPPGRGSRALQTLEGFTHPDWRRRGIARIGALLLLAGGFVVREHPVAVFSYECVPLARSIGMKPRLWQRDDGSSWVEVKI